MRGEFQRPEHQRDASSRFVPRITVHVDYLCMDPVLEYPVELPTSSSLRKLSEVTKLDIQLLTLGT